MVYFRMNMSFRFLKTKKFWMILAIIAVIGFGINASRAKPAATLVVESVKTGSLVQTVDASGSVESLRSTALSFESSGVVEAVLVDVGQSVRAGQALATLRAADQSADAAEADAAVRVAVASEAAARVALENAATDVENAKRSLSRTLQDNEQDLVEVRQDAVNAITSALITVRKAVSDADEVLGVDNPFGNQDYRNVLSALDGGALTDAKNAYAKAKAALVSAESPAFALTPVSDADAVDTALDMAESALAETAKLLLFVNRVLDATAIDTNDFSAAELTALKATVNTTRKAVQTSQDAVLAAHQAFASVAIAAAKAEDAARASLDQADAARKAADATLAVRVQETARARTLRSSASVRFNKTVLAAVADGTVTDITVDPGESAVAGTPVITVQTVDGAFEVAVDLAEADVAKVSVGDAAEVTFESFGETARFAGTVLTINPAQKIIEGVVYYEATIVLGAFDERYALKPGMTADAIITTERVENALFVPQRSVLRRDGSSYVRVKTGEATFEERPVMTGLRADGGLVQVLEGVKAGEEVVLSVKES